MPVIFVLISVLAAAGLAIVVLRRREKQASRAVVHAEYFNDSST
jgi:hypothetical protein